MTCSICNNEVDVQEFPGGTWDTGHNPYPVKTGADDRCCSHCNAWVVIPARLKMLMGETHNELTGRNNEDD